jgi:predicted AlkP superfamily phosphohydrolase/phosphomutase
MSKKLLVIGHDGASFDVCNSPIEVGDLKNLASLFAGDARADFETTFPPITCS